MARSKRSNAAEDEAPASFDFFNSMRAEAVVRGIDRNSAVVGLHLPQFALRYLFGNNVFRLGIFTELVGEPKQGKTAFEHEIERWHIFGSSAQVPYNPLIHDGGVLHIPVEPRFSIDLAESIMGVDLSTCPTVSIEGSSQALEDWQIIATDFVKRFQKFDEKQPGWPTFTACIGQDSLTQATTRKEMEDTWSNGYADPGFAQIAKNLSLWLKVFPTKLVPWPISFVATNHQKTGKDNRGFTTRKEPGGQAVGFGGTNIIRVQTVKNVEKLNENGRIIKLTFQKNSLSSAGDNRDIEVAMKWTYDEAYKTKFNPAGQRTVWDWNESSIVNLLSFDGTRKKRIEEIIYLDNVNKETKTANCAQLGIKKGSFSEIGAAMEGDPEVVKALDDLFRVTQRKIFTRGVPYWKQQDEALEQGSSIEQELHQVESPAPE